MQFRLPDVGEGITESRLLRWHVAAGQEIREDEPLCEIETDKAVVELPSPCTGTVIRLGCAEGATIAVGTVIAEITAADEAGTHEAIEAAADAPKPPPHREQDRAAEPAILAMPRTRAHARERGVDLRALTGTGPGGRVLVQDVEAAAVSTDAGDVERVQLAGLRRVIAEQMKRSVSSIPHATSMFRCDATAFAELRARFEAERGQRVSYTAMLMKAMVRPLVDWPFFNACFDEKAGEIELHRRCHIGFAAATREGLIVPVVRDVEQKSLRELSEEIARLAELARERRIALADLRGGTVTFSNLGSHGAGHEVGGRPIINHPQAAIIACGRIRLEAVVHEGVVVARPTMLLVTSYDHRLIDGAYATGFMEQLIAILEQPGERLRLD